MSQSAEPLTTANPASPIAAGVFTGESWRRAVVSAGRLEAGRTGLIPIGLIGFLARGGLLLFLIPILVLPTPIGLANYIGASAITASGPAPWFVDMLVALALIVVGTLLATTVVGAVADLLLLRAVLDARDASELRIGSGLVARASAVRLVALVPFALAAALGIARFAAATYHQLILPDDTATPFALRVLREAGDVAALVVVAWLIGETIGGLAVRHLVISTLSLPRALWRGATDLVRRPFTTLGTVVVGVGALIVAIVPALLVTLALWNRMPAMLENLTSGRAFVLTLLTTMIFVAVWAGGLALAGIAATWRSVLWDLEVLRTEPRRVPAGSAPAAGQPSQVYARPAADLAFGAGESHLGSGELTHTAEPRSL